MQVKCKLCSFYEDGFCQAKKPGGKHKMKANSNRSCDYFGACPEALLNEADKDFMKNTIPKYAPTWRYYANKKELIEAGEEKGAKYIRINPNA